MVVSTEYFPSIIWMERFLAQPQVMLQQWENYQKQGLMNRCKILGAQGIITLSVPLIGGREQKTLVRDVRINNTTRWNIDQLRAIRSCYSKAPFFEHYFYTIEQLLLAKHDNLLELNHKILELLIVWFRWKGNLNLTDTFEVNEFVKQPLSKTQSTKPIQYMQVFADRLPFTSGLSVLDLLFCTGPQASTLLLPPGSK